MPTYFDQNRAKNTKLVEITPKLVLYHVTKQKYLPKIFEEGLRIDCPNDGFCPGYASYTRLENHAGESIKPNYLYHTPDAVSAMISERWMESEETCVLRVRAEGLTLYDPNRGFPGEIVVLNDIEPWRLKRSKFAEWRLLIHIRRRERLEESMSARG